MATTSLAFTGRIPTVSPSSCQEPIIHPTSTATQTTILNPSLNGKCGGSQTCSGSNFGCCCSKFGYCGVTADYCGEGCNPFFGRCDSNTPIKPISNTTTGLTTLTSVRGRVTTAASSTTTGNCVFTITTTIKSTVTIVTTEIVSNIASSATTRSPLMASRSSDINRCVPIHGCAYRERGFAEYPGIDAISCKSKCNENSHCKAYEYGVNKSGLALCHLLDANASTSHSPLQSDAIIIEPCDNYTIYDSWCP